MNPLPNLMVAPNGARRGKADHPALPVTDDELIACAKSCFAAGADGLHFHLRDAAERHVLDAGRYRALLDQLAESLPDMYLQVTSETAGFYDAAEQQAMVRALVPKYVSVGLREMVRRPEDWAAARDFYHWAADSGVEIQHILYSPDDVRNFVVASDGNRIPGEDHRVLFVQGSYTNGSTGAIPLERYLDPLTQAGSVSFEWMACAFGAGETASLVRAAELGGKARVGFENSLWNADGHVAEDNAARVREVGDALRGHNSF
jgi:uncharacterized protein (DUF849 family)